MSEEMRRRFEGHACGEEGLARLEALPHGPTDEAIEAARRLIIRPPWVYQTSDGGIQLEWQGDLSMRLRINPDGTQG